MSSIDARAEIFQGFRLGWHLGASVDVRKRGRQMHYTAGGGRISLCQRANRKALGRQLSRARIRSIRPEPSLSTSSALCRQLRSISGLAK